MRDVENDAACGKVTLAVRLGSAGGKLYHVLILCIGISAWLYGLNEFTGTSFIDDVAYWSIGPGLVLAVFQGLFTVLQKKREGYDRLLKLMVLVTLLTALGYILPVLLI